LLRVPILSVRVKLAVRSDDTIHFVGRIASEDTTGSPSVTGIQATYAVVVVVVVVVMLQCIREVVVAKIEICMT